MGEQRGYLCGVVGCRVDEHDADVQVGDVRANSVKRVASAVGEGSVVISDIHRYLADHRNPLPVQPNSTLAALRSANAAVQGSASS